MRSFWFFVFWVSVAQAAQSQSGPSFDCSKAGSVAEQLICAEPDLAALDLRLADVYGSALSVAQGLDAGAEAATDTLKAMQRGWIKGRDECWKADDLRTCVETAYLTREAELVATWLLKEPVAVSRWICGETPANEVYVMYFDTELPGLRVEYGDGVEAMHLAPSGSGSRYEGAFGRMFWEKGGEARFLWTQDREQICTIAE